MPNQIKNYKTEFVPSIERTGLGCLFALLIIALLGLLSILSVRLLQGPTIPPQPPLPTSQPLPGRVRYIATQAKGRAEVSVRGLPNASSAIVEQLLPGSQVTVTDYLDDRSGTRWLRVELASGLAGWIPKQFLQPAQLELAAVQAGERFGDTLESLRPNGVFAGPIAMVAVEYDWRNAAENMTKFSVSVSPEVIDVHCEQVAKAIDGRAGCNLGQLPQGAYEVSILANGERRRTLPVLVVDAEQPPDGVTGPPAFECKAVQGWAEDVICASPLLSSLDRQLDSAFSALVASPEPRNALSLRADQKAWLAGRLQCRSEICLKQAYQMRLQEIASATANATALDTAAPETIRSATPAGGGYSPRYLVQDLSLGAKPVGDAGSWFSPNDYPPSAFRHHIEGRTVAKLAISRDGRVLACGVSRSSGSTELDDATCRVLLLRGRFMPARDRRGQSVVGTYICPVRWQL